MQGLQRRTYRKIHLGVDPNTSLIVAGVVTPCQQHDSQVVEAVLTVARPAAGFTAIGDGAYDCQMCYSAAKRRKVHLLTPSEA